MPVKIEHSNIALINPLWNAWGGSEHRTMQLYKILGKQTSVSLWATREPVPELLGSNCNIRVIDAERRMVPQAETIVIVGVYYSIASWIGKICRPRRIIIVFNTNHLNLFRRRLQEIPSKWRGLVEVVFPSFLFQKKIGLDGIVEYSPVDLKHFIPKTDNADKNDLGKFVLGRMSRDRRFKHHWRDPSIYRTVVREGWHVRLMGATRWLHKFKRIPEIDILGCGMEDAVEFLQSLDVFFYRTSPMLLEAYGRVVVEAMSCGIPVVACARGGYTEIIDDGIDGFLFKSQAEALMYLRSLFNEAGMRADVSGAARLKVEQVYGREAHSRMLEFYLK